MQGAGKWKEIVELPLEALADTSTLHSCLVVRVSSTGVPESFARAAGSLRTNQIGSPLNLNGNGLVLA
jgi:hypothetical protein